MGDGRKLLWVFLVCSIVLSGCYSHPKKGQNGNATNLTVGKVQGIQGTQYITMLKYPHAKTSKSDFTGIPTSHYPTR